MTKTETKVAEISVSYKPSRAHKPLIKSSDDAYYNLLKFFPEHTISLYESFVVGYLNQANRLIGIYELSKGGITGTVADPRLVLSVALKTAAKFADPLLVIGFIALDIWDYNKMVDKSRPEMHKNILDYLILIVSHKNKFNIYIKKF